MTPTVDLNEVKSKLTELIRPSGWADKLKTFIQSSDFDHILQTLYDHKMEGRRFTPPLKYIFRAFQVCPIDKLKVVIIGQDPYPQLGVADGVAFSCSITDKVQPSLKQVFNELDRLQGHQDRDPDLTRWSKQGVLLLNKALSCQLDKPGSHMALWEPFISYLIDMLSLTQSGLVFVLMGTKAHELEELITDAHHVIRTAHPAAASYTGGQWNSFDFFGEVNQVLQKQYGPQHTIKW